MAKIYKTTKNIRLPKESTAKEEFGKARKGLEVCKTCHAFYYKKSWHHDIGKFLEAGIKGPGVKFSECPACRMIKRGTYEGKIIIKNVPEKNVPELMNLIKNYAKRMLAKDPMDRLIDIKKSGKILTITTTENQLALKLAKKIKEVFKKVDMATKFAKESHDDVLITLIFNK